MRLGLLHETRDERLEVRLALADAVSAEHPLYGRTNLGTHVVADVLPKTAPSETRLKRLLRGLPFRFTRTVSSRPFGASLRRIPEGSARLLSPLAIDPICTSSRVQ